jgi:hypothetical protein
LPSPVASARWAKTPWVNEEEVFDRNPTLGV